MDKLEMVLLDILEEDDVIKEETMDVGYCGGRPEQLIECYLSEQIPENEWCKLLQDNKELRDAWELKSHNLGVNNVEREYETMAKTTFEEIIEVVLHHEGGFVDDPDDKGGATNHGVTQGTLEQYRENDVSREDVQNLTVDEAKECYHEMFWKPSMAEKLPEEVRHLYFDMVVNHGQGNAVKILQMACRGQGDDVDVDGAIGPSTLRAAEDIEEWELLAERTGFYWNLVFDGSRYQKRNRQQKFIRGWLRRAFSFMND